MRPATGARSSVNSRSSSAWRTAASLAATEACAARNAWVRWSKVCSVMVRSRTSCLARSRSASVKARLALACASVPLRLRNGVLERPLVDGEQEIALLDHLAVAEMDLVEIARDAGAHLDRIHRDEAADIFVLIGDAALDRLGHRHGRRRRRAAARRLALAAAGQRPAQAGQGRRQAADKERESWDLCCQQIADGAMRQDKGWAAETKGSRDCDRQAASGAALQDPRDGQRRHQHALVALGPQFGGQLVGDVPGENNGAIRLIDEHPALLDHRDEGAGHALADLQ